MPLKNDTYPLKIKSIPGSLKYLTMPMNIPKPSPISMASKPTESVIGRAERSSTKAFKSILKSKFIN